MGAGAAETRARVPRIAGVPNIDWTSRRGIVRIAKLYSHHILRTPTASCVQDLEPRLFLSIVCHNYLTQL